MWEEWVKFPSIHLCSQKDWGVKALQPAAQLMKWAKWLSVTSIFGAIISSWKKDKLDKNGTLVGL